MNITRLGHYHTPSGADEKGSCQTALVVSVEDNENPVRSIVNLVVWTKEGDERTHLDVREDDPYLGIERGEATFHLSTICPWLK